MFLLGIYCAGGYGGSVSAILINTQGTPHAAATMLDGYPLSKMGRTKAALKIALYASTFGGIFSALVLLFLGPQVAKISAQLGTAEYFMVCLFGMTIIAGVSGKSLVKGIIAACLGLLISCVGADPMTSYDRFTFGIPRLYLGLDLADFSGVKVQLIPLQLCLANDFHQCEQTDEGNGKVKTQIQTGNTKCKADVPTSADGFYHRFLCWYRTWHGCVGGLVVLLQHCEEPVQASRGTSACIHLL